MPSVLVLCLLALVQARGGTPPTAPDTTQEAFIVEQMVNRIRFEKDGTGRREVQARMKVQSEAGVQMLGQLGFGYSAATEKLDIQYVRVRKADGTVITAPADAVQDLSSPVQQYAPVYTDFRQKHVTVPGLRPGETLEYLIVTTVHTPLAAGHFWMEHDFERDAIVLDEQLELDIPAGRTVTLKTASDAQPRITEADGRLLYRWTSAHTAREKEKDEDTLLAETEALAENPRRASVRMTTFRSWEEVGTWYANLENASRAVTPEIRRKAQELTAGRKTEMDKLQALYDFVAPGFRYVSISLGMGRYQPRAAADVLRDQYGDCKDKHTLLAALMSAVDLRTSTVLINSEVKLDPDFPSPSQFDHVITHAQVDGQEAWLDVTTEVAPFRLLSANLRKKQALVISAAGRSRLAETPADPPVPSFVLQEVRGTLVALGTFNGTVKMTLRGDAELMMRIAFRRTPAANWKDVIQQIEKSAGMGGEISEPKVSDPASTDAPFTVEYKVSKTALVDWTKKTAALILPFSDFTLPDRSEKALTSKVELGSPTRLEYRFDLQLGPEYKARAPLPVAVKRDYADYTGTYVLDGQRFTAHRALDLRITSLPAERSGDYRSFRRAVAADEAQRLTLEVAAAASDAPAPDLKAPQLVRAGYDALHGRNPAQAVTLLKRAVELAPKDTNAWVYLGDAYMQLRRYDEALAAYNQLLKVNPYDEFVHNKVAYVYSTQRKYPEAEAALRRQLELNPLDKYAHATLGGLLVDVEKFDAAVVQLEKAVSQDPDSANLRVELGTALLGLDKDDDALAAFSKAVELSPAPTTWNNVAYQLALNGVHLDRALQYAESAVSAAAAASRQLSVQHFTEPELGVMISLASYWDTLGSVYLAKGDFARAEALVHVSWLLGYIGEVGDHLAQIYEKQGRTEEAVRMYAIALNAEQPPDSTRTRLEALAGSKEAAELRIRRHAPELLKMRTYPITAPKQLRGAADFLVLLGADARPEAVRFVGGDEKLRPLANALHTLQFGPPLPTAAPAKILRRGTIMCDAVGCAFILFPTHHLQPVK